MPGKKQTPASVWPKMTVVCFLLTLCVRPGLTRGCAHHWHTRLTKQLPPQTSGLRGRGRVLEGTQQHLHLPAWG